MAAERKKGSSGRGASRSSGRGNEGRGSSGPKAGSRGQGGASHSSAGRGGPASSRSASGAGSSRGGGSGRGSSSPRGGASQRGGFGDDQGTRVGSPDSGTRGSGSKSGYRGPSTQPVNEGLEGSILEGSTGQGDSEGRPRRTGAGSEATEGIHGASSRRGETSRTSTTNARTASRETASGSSRITNDRSGSEPMKGSEHQHVSGYGGAGGTPKSSSDQRESTRKSEQPLGGSRKRGSRAQGRLGDEEAGDGL